MKKVLPLPLYVGENTNLSVLPLSPQAAQGRLNGNMDGGIGGMKKFLLLVILITCLSSMSLFAQTVLTPAFNPKPGDIITRAVANDTGYLYPGAAGTNQNWDFSSLTFNYATTTLFVSDTSVHDSATQFPGDFPYANVAWYDTVINHSSNYNYYNANGSQLVNWGNESLTDKVVYSTPEKIFTYPFAYNDTLINAFAGQGFNTSTSFTRKGTVTTIADGNGTLTTPQGVFYGVLRINSREQITDSLEQGGAGYTYSNQTYTWYAGGHKSSLLALTFDTTIYNGYVYPSFSVTYGLDTASAVKTITPSFLVSIFPNPASDELFIKTDKPINNIAITNVLGEKVLDLPQHNVLPGSAVKVSLADLPSGIYLCTVTTPSGILSKRIVKK